MAYVVGLRPPSWNLHVPRDWKLLIGKYVHVQERVMVYGVYLPTTLERAA